MNPLRRFACRVFQKVLYVAAAFLPFREPKELHGYEALAEELTAHGLRHPLIVTDQGLFRLKVHEGLVEALRQKGIEPTVFSDVVANPTFACVEEGYSLYTKESCDSLIALGGGSSMDAAKAIGIRVAYPQKSLAKFKGLLHVHRKIPLLFAIPTTAGTGSEATLAAVVVDEKTRDKFQIDDPKLIPYYAVFEPKLLLGLPSKIIAATGMDALTHAVEAYIGHSNTRQTKACALEAVGLISTHLIPFCKNPNLKDAGKMQRASYLAGVAFTRAYVGYVHALAHSLGGTYNVAHGYANAVLLPYVLDAYGAKAWKKLASLADLIQLAPLTDSDEKKAKAFIAYVRKLNAELGIDEHFVGLVKEEDFASLASHADKEGNPLYPVPKEMDARELEEILRKACR